MGHNLTRQQQEDHAAADVKILQKVNAAHRTAFGEKYDGQIEHILRLLCERLQAGLDKRSGVNITDSQTWLLTPTELAEMSQAVYNIHLIRESMRK